jgi:hypothetical protein
MASVLTCSCGAVVRIRRADEKKRIECPRCHAELRPAAEEAICTTPASPAPRAAADPSHKAPVPPAAPASQDLAIEVEPDPGLREKDRKRATRGQRRGLRAVHLGLAFHFPSPVAFLLAALTTGLTLGLAGLSHSPRTAGAAGPAVFFGYVSTGFFLLTGLLEIAPSVLALGLTDGPGRWFFGVAFVLRCGACLLACLVLFFPTYAPGHLGMALVAMTIAWGLWMAGLYRLGFSVNRKDITEGAVRITFRGLKILGIAMFTLLITFAIIGVSIRYPPLLFVFPPAMIGAALKIAFTLGDFDSMLRFFFAPTGVPFLLEYLNFIIGVRTILERRT